VNLDRVPAPETGWAPALLAALPAVAVLAIALAWTLRTPSTPAEEAPVRRGAAIAFGSLWAAAGAAPLLLPSVGWLPYYALPAAFGAWLAIAAALAAWPWLAAALVLGVAALAPVHARTPALEWGSDWYLRRAAFFVGGLRDVMLSHRPRLEPGTRLWFGSVPNGVGAGEPWFDPAFHVWYRDSTIHGARLSAYRPRSPGEPQGADLFFRYDAASAGWVEIVAGAEDVARARAENPAWEADHRELAERFGAAGDWASAATEIEKLQAANPDAYEYSLDLATCRRALGDETEAQRLERRADSLRTIEERRAR